MAPKQNHNYLTNSTLICLYSTRYLNGTIGVSLEPVPKYPLSSKSLTLSDEHFQSFIYTCVILSLFAVVILMLMLRIFREEESDDELLKTLRLVQSKIAWENTIREKRQLMAAKRHALRFIEESSGSSSRRGSEEHSIALVRRLRKVPFRMKRMWTSVPSVIVTKATPPSTPFWNRRKRIRTRSVCAWDSSSDEECYRSGSSSSTSSIHGSRLAVGPILL